MPPPKTEQSALLSDQTIPPPGPRPSSWFRPDNHHDATAAPFLTCTLDSREVNAVWSISWLVSWEEKTKRILVWRLRISVMESRRVRISLMFTQTTSLWLTSSNWNEATGDFDVNVKDVTPIENGGWGVKQLGPHSFTHWPFLLESCNRLSVELKKFFFSLKNVSSIYWAF